MTTINRRTTREAFASALSAALTTVSSVYDYPVKKPQGSPVVVVSSGGSRRNILTRYSFNSIFDLNVVILVKTKAVGGTDDTQNAEDLLDNVEHEIAEFVLANQNNANWIALDYAGASEVINVTFEGEDYAIEPLKISVEVE